MRWAFPALSLGSLAVWSALFVASGFSLVLTVNDALDVVRGDEVELRTIARIETAEGALRNLELHAGEYVLRGTPPNAAAYARARAALSLALRVLDGDTNPGVSPREMARAEAAVADGVSRIEAALAGPPAAAGLVLVGIDGLPRFPLDEALEHLGMISAAITERLLLNHDSLQRESDQVVLSFVAAGVLYLIFQLWLYALMRKDLKTRNALQQALIGANAGLNDRVAERTRELEDRNRELALVSRKVLEAQERERRILALQLHDDIGQDLAALVMLQRRIACGESKESRPGQSQLIGECIEIAQAVYQRVADISLTLRPSMLDRLGFAAALNWYGRQAEARSKCKVTVAASAVPADLPERISIVAFRIAQEAVSNAIRHARAQTIHVQACRKEDRFCLCIRDDGVGFDPEEIARDTDPFAGFGILGMKERARNAGGKLSVDSMPGRGTRVNAEFLWPADALDSAAIDAMAAENAVGSEAGAVEDEHCSAAVLPFKTAAQSG